MSLISPLVFKKRPLGALLWLTALPGVLSARELTGVLYSEHSGPSATGTGEARIATADGMVVSLFFQKPVKKVFSKAVCNDLGAVWRVTTEVLPERGETLVAATCTGQINVAVHSAWLGVKRFLEVLAQGEAQGSERLSAGERSAASHINWTTIDLSGYSRYGQNGKCLEVDRQVGRDIVNIRTSLDCLIDTAFEFRVGLVSGDAWQVLSVKRAN